MSSNVSQAEVEALRSPAGARSRSLDVTVRDFAHPRTLSKERMRHLSKSLSARLGAIANALAGSLRNHHKLQVGELAEVTAHGLFDGFMKPFIVHGFQCAGRLAWLVWDSAAAMRVSDIVLSGPAPAAQSSAKGTPAPKSSSEGAPPVRTLTRTEGRVVSSLLDTILAELAEALHLDVERGEIWQEPEELTSLEDLGPDADSRRLMIHLIFDGPGGASEMRLYLPGVVAEDDEDKSKRPKDAPPHLAAVGVRVAAELGATLVPLRELLELEVGDVIPLNAHIGQPVIVRVEDHIRATGHFGSHKGRMAVVIDRISSSPDEDPTSED